jgi:hypothetical protein
LPFAAEYIIRADYRCHFEEMRDSSVATKAGSGISLSNANGRPYIVYWLRKVVFSILILEKLRASRLNEGLGHYSFSISSDCL